MEKITNQEQIEYLGMDGDTLKRLEVDTNMDAGMIDINKAFDDNLISDLKNELNTLITPLRQCLETSDMYPDNDYITIGLSEKTDLAIAVLHDTLIMKLFPPKNLLVNNNTLDLPVFEVEYTAKNIPIGFQKESLINSIKKSVLNFEGEFLFELLNKAVRSQRNKIEKDINFNSIHEAIELIERENENIYNILANTKAHSILRKEIIINNNLLLEGINIIHFSPSGRMNKNRVYFMGRPNLLGRFCKTDFAISVDIQDKQYDISCLVRMAAVILNRDIISVIEH